MTRLLHDFPLLKLKLCDCVLQPAVSYLSKLNQFLEFSVRIRRCICLRDLDGSEFFKSNLIACYLHSLLGSYRIIFLLFVVQTGSSLSLEPALSLEKKFLW